MNTIQFYRFAIRIIRGAFKVLEILVVVAEDACEKLPDPKLVSCVAVKPDDIAGPILLIGRKDSISIPTDNLIVVPAGTQIISPSKNPSPTP